MYPHDQSDYFSNCSAVIGDNAETTDIVEFSNLRKLSLKNVTNYNTSLISTCTGLTSLTLDKCNINTTTYLSNLTSLTYLNLDNNGISTLDGLSNMTSLKTLCLDTNNLTLSALDTLKNLHENGSLTRLYITNNSTLDKTKIPAKLENTEKEWEVLEYDK